VSLSKIHGFLRSVLLVLCGGNPPDDSQGRGVDMEQERGAFKVNVAAQPIDGWISRGVVSQALRRIPS